MTCYIALSSFGAVYRGQVPQLSASNLQPLTSKPVLLPNHLSTNNPVRSSLNTFSSWISRDGGLSLSQLNTGKLYLFVYVFIFSSVRVKLPPCWGTVLPPLPPTPSPIQYLKEIRLYCLDQYCILSKTEIKVQMLSLTPLCTLSLLTTILHIGVHLLQLINLLLLRAHLYRPQSPQCAWRLILAVAHSVPLN